MDSVSVSQALAIRNAPVHLAVGVAVAQKNMQAAETAGDAVLSLLDQSTVPQHTPDPSRTIDFRA